MMTVAAAMPSEKAKKAKKIDNTSQLTPSTPVKSPQKLSVGRELLDTTWRMTVPVVIFASLGIFLDITVGSKPWLTLLGSVIGFYFAIQLVKQQIARGDNSDAPKDSAKNSDSSDGDTKA
jgi:F0F1-type ATP synthase assembly protein I